MLPGPIFAVELVTSARRARYFVVRVVYAAVLLFTLWITYIQWSQWRSMDGVGDIAAVANLTAQFFGTFAVMQLLAVVLLGPAMVAGTVATERERRTIEYLFASQLSNAEIVLGKLFARVIHVICLVLVGVPVLALAMLMGGIAPEALLVLLIITLSTVVTVAVLSIAVSVWSARAREAVTRAYLVLFALLILPPLLSLLRGEPWFQYTLEPLNEQLLAANPFYVLTTAMAQASGLGTAIARDIVFALVRNHLIVSLLFGGAATLAVRRVHLRHRADGTRKRWRLMHRLRPGIGNNPMLWKEVFAEPAASRLGWIGRIALTLIVLGVIGPTLYMFVQAIGTVSSYRSFARDYEGYATFMGTLLACGGLLLVAARAAGGITSEKERDCWTSLLSTPLEPREIVLAKIAGNLWSIRGVVALLLLIWGLGVALDPHFIVAVPFLLGTFLLLAAYAAALGTLFSLWCRNSLRAMGATLATGLFVGGLYMFCCIPVMIGGPGPDFAEIMLTPCVPFLLAFPGICYMEGFPSGHDGGVTVAYVIGVLGYGVAAGLLSAAAVGNFDSFAGRTGLPSPPPFRRLPTSGGLVTSSAVGQPRSAAGQSPFMPPEPAAAIDAEIVES